MPTAQQTYAVMLREHVAPALRSAGLRGSARQYRLPSPTCHALVGFQATRYSTAAEVRFTVNLLVVTRNAWATLRQTRPHMPEAPFASYSAGPDSPIWQQRLGIVATGIDTWWPVRADDDPATAAQGVLAALAALAEHGLPALRTQVADRNP